MTTSRNRTHPVRRRSSPRVGCDCSDDCPGAPGEPTRAMVAACNETLFAKGTALVASAGGALVVSPARGSSSGKFAIASSPGHGGEVVQGCQMVRRRETTVLISLPDLTRRSVAACLTERGRGRIHVASGLTKAHAAASLVLARAQRSDIDIYCVVASSIPEGVGAGRSSADCHAVIKAASAALGLHLQDAEVANIAFEAERAADPLAMFDWGVTLLWASRQGRIIEVIPAPLPPMKCVVAVADVARTVSTTEQVSNTTYTQYEIEAFRKILARARKAILAGDAGALVRAGADSLELNQRRCPTPRLEAIRCIAQGAGALGVLGSHSGSVVVVAFDALAEGLQHRIDDAARALGQLGCADVHSFSNRGSP